MAVKTVNAQGFDPAMALGRTTEARQAVGGGSQSFGEILNQAGDKAAGRNQTALKGADNAKNAGQKKPETGADSKKAEEAQAKPEETVGKGEPEAKTDAVEKEPGEKTNMFDEKLKGKTEEGSEKLTAQQLADALAQLLEQIKQLLGISDEELLAGMEALDLGPADLLNTDNMAQLLTAIAGGGEAISFVTNEDLYAALQEMTAAVEGVAAQLLEDTGLTEEELAALLEKLSQQENAAEEEPAQPADLAEATVTDAVNKDAALSQEAAPVVVVEDYVKPWQAKAQENQLTDNQYKELPENQQENPTEGAAKVQPQKSERDAHENANDWNGQQGNAPGFGDALNETAQAAADAAVSYTSETVDSILKQLADVVKIVKNENLTEMQLQLHPASLGTVNVSLVTKGGAVTAEFTTQNEAVRAAIESQVSQLITNLEEQGVKVEAVEVSVASHQMERNLEEDGQNEQSRQEQEERQRVQGARRSSINLNAFADDDELAEEMQEADDATRIAMEMMTANGNSMDLIA